MHWDKFCKGITGTWKQELVIVNFCFFVFGCVCIILLEFCYLYPDRIIATLIITNQISLLYTEITQEVASKGLGLVYEHGGGGNKDELVSMLVNTLMAGRRQV